MFMSAVIAMSPVWDVSAHAIVDVPYDISVSISVKGIDAPETEEYVVLEKEPEEQSSVYIPSVKPEIEEPAMSEEDIELIALVTMAEAEGEPELGKRLVIDTILNRMDHDTKWPDTASGVIYQAHQFTSMWNGRVDRCYVRDDIVQLVREELESRTNSECVYFRTGRYSDYGTPLFQEGRHYFSGV